MLFLQHLFSFGAYIIKTLFFLFSHIYIYIEMAPKQLQRGNISEIRFPDPTSNQWSQRSQQKLPAPTSDKTRSMNPLASALRVETRQVRMLLDFPHLSGIPWVPSHGDESGIFPGTWKHHKNERKMVWYILPIHEKPYIYRCMKHVDIQSSHGCYVFFF